MYPRAPVDELLVDKDKIPTTTATMEFISPIGIGEDVHDQLIGVGTLVLEHVVRARG